MTVGWCSLPVLLYKEREIHTQICFYCRTTVVLVSKSLTIFVCLLYGKRRMLAKEEYLIILIGILWGKKSSSVCRAALITVEVVFCVISLCSISAGNTCGSWEDQVEIGWRIIPASAFASYSIFMVHQDGKLYCIYLPCFCSVLPLQAVPHLACLKIIQLSPGKDWN